MLDISFFLYQPLQPPRDQLPRFSSLKKREKKKVFSMRPRPNFFLRSSVNKKGTVILEHKNIESWDKDIQLHCPNLIAELSGAGGGR